MPTRTRHPAAVTLALLALLGMLSSTSASAREWKLLHRETFAEPMRLADGQAFGEGGWLTASIRGGGSIVTGEGKARVSTPSFRDSALIRVTRSLPPEYRLSVRVSRIDFSIDNYTDEDFRSAGFKYNRRYLENGFYWLALTDRLVEPLSGEDWWHRHRKAVIDSDDHLEERFPAYVAFMNPHLDRKAGDWTGGALGLLRCWSPSNTGRGEWDASPDAWTPAFHYEPGAAYRVEIEKTATHLVFRAFHGDGALIAETDPVPLDDVHAMGRQASEFEYAYVGEPHIDSYRGQALVEEIALWVPAP